jgi:hypothetical protein
MVMNTMANVLNMWIIILSILMCIILISIVFVINF